MFCVCEKMYSRIFRKIFTSVYNCYSSQSVKENTKHIVQRKWLHKGKFIYNATFRNVPILAVTVGYFSYRILDAHNVAYADIKKSQDYLKDNQPKIPQRSDLPIYSFNEVSKHVSNETGIWVTYQNGVYDVTDFVHQHPGGDQILMAAGNAVDPFWMLYSVHTSPHVLNILEQYRIGNLDPKECNDGLPEMHDPFSNEPTRHSLLKPASIKPFNAEAPEYTLVDSFITPNNIFFVRNHLPVPDINPKDYLLEIEIEGEPKTLALSLDDLKKFPKYSVTSTVMCAGNRRSEMHKLLEPCKLGIKNSFTSSTSRSDIRIQPAQMKQKNAPIRTRKSTTMSENQVKSVKGLSWGVAAVGNAVWSGASLREVLEKAGLSENDIDRYQHIQFEAYDKDTTGAPYGASIPIWKAVDKRGDVILAYEMNGEILPPDHGFPVRAIVPGVVGARNVKWLAKIIVSSEESQSHWQQKDYKGFSPSTDWDSVDYSKSPSIQELPVTSAICLPSNNSTVKVKDGKIITKGYAWSGGGQEIVRVDVTCDGGKTWHVAKFDHHAPAKSPQHWSWTLWSCELPISKDAKEVEIMVKSVDSSYNTQPESFENIWNLRGVLNNAYHKIRVNLE